MVIYFNVPEVRDFLLKHGSVYTVRRKRREGRTMAREGSYYAFREIGRVQVEHQAIITRQSDLGMFVKNSGFGTLEQWLSAIRKLKLPADEWQLYYVELIPDES